MSLQVIFFFPSSFNHFFSPFFFFLLSFSSPFAASSFASSSLKLCVSVLITVVGFFSESLLGSLQGIEVFSVGTYSGPCKWLSFFSGSLFKSLPVIEFFFSGSLFMSL